MFPDDTTSKFYRWAKELQRLYTEEISMRVPDGKRGIVEKELFQIMGFAFCEDGARFLCRFADSFPVEIKADRRVSNV